MQKYNVLVEEIHASTVCVLANSEEEAVAIVCKAHDKGRIDVTTEYPDVNIDTEHTTEAEDGDELYKDDEGNTLK